MGPTVSIYGDLDEFMNFHLRFGFASVMGSSSRGRSTSGHRF